MENGNKSSEEAYLAVFGADAAVQHADVAVIKIGGVVHVVLAHVEGAELGPVKQLVQLIKETLVPQEIKVERLTPEGR
jgi:hypothetical protein